MYFVINLIGVCDDHSGQSVLLIIIRFCTSHHLQFVRAFVTILNLSRLLLPIILMKTPPQYFKHYSYMQTVGSF